MNAVTPGVTAIRSTAPARGLAVFAVVCDFVAEVDARLEERMGPEKMQRLRALLEELNQAL